MESNSLYPFGRALIFHGFWHAGPAEFQNQLNHFFKNLAPLGALLVLLGVEQERYLARRGARRARAGFMSRA